MGIDWNALPGDPAEDDFDLECLAQAGDRERADDVTTAADPEDQRSPRGLDLRDQAGTGSASLQIERIAAAARSNSSSAITGVPSKGSSRSISTQDRQP
jgi:hypothetical protein